MDASIVLRQLLRTPSTYRTLLTVPPRPQCQSRTLSIALHPIPHPRHLTVPRILQPSFWSSMIPRPLRESSSLSPHRGWNPATPYIVLGLLVGSQAIQILWLKQERGHELRRAEAKIGILKEVIERVRRGEEVDVEGMLGTGKEQEERDWAEVMKQIEKEEKLFTPKQQRKAAREAAAAAEETKRAGQATEEVVEKSAEEPAQNGQDSIKVETISGAKFY
ncbi:hypothetical protein P280DRAFT_447008 [Massarina eburnea CBS 473.64]|uniref:Uncharacterized protein n=1 Tax=Massarina eburnea CBS 473.64 TaxID=1395130 RepID=A0A6A6S895_9PLEO|nr:hypothetical protein P280DRAFT_447008 [Massarina eburnea CBS 473.64]